MKRQSSAKSRQLWIARHRGFSRAERNRQAVGYSRAMLRQRSPALAVAPGARRRAPPPRLDRLRHGWSPDIAAGSCDKLHRISHESIYRFISRSAAPTTAPAALSSQAKAKRGCARKADPRASSGRVSIAERPEPTTAPFQTLEPTSCLQNLWPAILSPTSACPVSSSSPDQQTAEPTARNSSPAPAPVTRAAQTITFDNAPSSPALPPQSRPRYPNLLLRYP